MDFVAVARVSVSPPSRRPRLAIVVDGEERAFVERRGSRTKVVELMVVATIHPGETAEPHLTVSPHRAIANPTGRVTVPVSK